MLASTAPQKFKALQQPFILGHWQGEEGAVFPHQPTRYEAGGEPCPCSWGLVLTRIYTLITPCPHAISQDQ